MIYLYEKLAKKILNAKGKIRISLDLGKSYVEVDAEELRRKIGEENL